MAFLGTILTDFDGVCTNQIDEALAVKQNFMNHLVQECGANHESVRAAISEVEAEMAQNPFEHGWRFNGRITAYAGEDYFVRCNAMAACMDNWALQKKHPFMGQILSVLQKNGFVNYSALSQRSYEDLVKATLEGKHAPMDQDAVEGIRALMKRGYRVVVVSNSSVERILDLLGRANLDGRTYGSHPNYPLEVHGNARKFELSESPKTIRVGTIDFAIDRPKYHQILLEVRPLAVVGDVFSLDLALPLKLREKQLPGLKLFLPQAPYTPKWIDPLFSNLNQMENFIFKISNFKEVGNYFS